MRVLFRPLVILAVTIFGIAIAQAAESLMNRIKSLEPIIGAYPANIRSREEFEAVKKRYDDLKLELDGLVSRSPKDQSLLFMRAHLQRMGHNFDYPGAWQGATDDLKAILNSNPTHVPAMLELGNLWVNSNPALAPNAEKLFRSAQCNKGIEPLEDAQRGLFFAFYYQGKMPDALRQSEYLKQTWPQNEQYKHLNEMVRTVISRSGEAKPPIGATKFEMATCNE